MKNISQIRAGNAIKHAKVTGQNGGDVVKGLPMLILTNGLLAVLAMSLEKKSGGTGLKQEGAHTIMCAIADHLRSDGIAITKAKDAATLVAELVAPAADAALLRRATAEALAFLSYLKRFAS